VLFATEGKDAGTVEAFAADLAAHGGSAEAVTEGCIDMSQAFIAGTAASLPEADVTFDKFHVVRIINDAVDEVRRTEQKSRGELKNSRYVWLKNPDNLSDRQQAQLRGLAGANLKTARAYQIRLTFQDLYQQRPSAAETFLKKWYFWATHCRLPPMIEAARTIKRHWDGVLRWFHTRIANGILEGINSLVQAAKAKARGYRSTRNLKAIIYLIAGKLQFHLPT
jgi:transposase